MALPTDLEYQSRLVAELGDTPSGKLAALIPALWAQYPQFTGYRRYLAVKAQALTLLIGDLIPKLDDPLLTAERVTAVRTQLAIRQAQQESVTAELSALPSSSNPVLVGDLTVTAPVSPPYGPPDGNDRGYGGDLYRRRGGGY